MAILYVIEQGAIIRHLGGRIIVRREDRVIQELPDFKLEQIVAFGNVSLTPDLMRFCFQQGVDVAFVSTTGKYRGRLQPEFTKNVFLRQKQYERTADPNFCVATASVIVAGKIRNMIEMIRLQRRLRENVDSPVAELRALLPRVASARSIDSLNGYEGTATAAYFRTLRAALKGDWGFDTRQYHPPADPVNALLSLGYTMLYNNVYAAINIVGFEPFLGVLHQPRYGHAALASDLMEEYRCVLVDRLVLTVLNKRLIAKDDFVKTGEGQLRLAPDALKRFLALYAAQLNETVHYPPQNIRTTYRQVIELQARQFARYIMGEEQAYRPYAMADCGLQNVD